ncbi:MAG: hypothetical protein N4A49_08330 [Marinifilaceae bacterium]|jgi:IS30 family transposase|nr:hypothetical protein [Marinifilaceae bacterium]
MQSFIELKIKESQWSPKQIVGYCRTNSIEMVSHERIYQYLREDKAQVGDLWKYTRHKLKHRKRPINGKHQNIKNKISIEKMDNEDKVSILKVLDGFIKSVKIKDIATL